MRTDKKEVEEEDKMKVKKRQKIMSRLTLIMTLVWMKMISVEKHTKVDVDGYIGTIGRTTVAPVGKPNVRAHYTFRNIHKHIRKMGKKIFLKKRRAQF